MTGADEMKVAMNALSNSCMELGTQTIYGNGGTSRDDTFRKRNCHGIGMAQNITITSPLTRNEMENTGVIKR